MSRASDIRLHVDPRDVPPEKVARRLHPSLSAVEGIKPRLLMRRFPRPDPDAGMYDLDAVGRRRNDRHLAQFLEVAQR